MNPWLKSPQVDREPGPYKVGDKVSILMGAEPTVTTIIEDRGNIGSNGSRFYRVRYWHQDVPEPYEVDFPVEWLTLVERAPEPPPEKPKGRRRAPRKSKGRRELTECPSRTGPLDDEPFAGTSVAAPTTAAPAGCSYSPPQ